MSYASEEQWQPIICEECGDNIWVMGERVKPHKCYPNYTITKPKDLTDDSLEQFVNNQLAPLNLQSMAKQILGFTRG